MLSETSRARNCGQLPLTIRAFSFERCSSVGYTMVSTSRSVIYSRMCQRTLKGALAIEEQSRPGIQVAADDLPEVPRCECS